MPLPSNLQSFYWKVSWQAYGSSFRGDSFLFPFLLLIFFIFNFCHFSYNVTWCRPFGLILFGIFCGSWTWMCFYSQFREVFHSYVFKYALCHFLSLFSFWDPYNANVNISATKLLQLCPTLCDPIDGSLPGSPVPGILPAITLEWVAISFSTAWKWKVKGKSLSRVWLLVTPWTAAYEVPPSMGFSRQEYWSGVPLKK